MKRQIKALLLSPAAKAFVDRIEAGVPLVRKWHRFEYEQHFLRVAKWERLFSGIYPTFAAVQAAIPATRNNSFDNPDSAKFEGHKRSVHSSDYPVLFWLERLLPENPKVFDFGGYLGISYYSFKNYLKYPANLDWTVYDVPAVVEAGTKLAGEKGETQLSFTTALARAREFPLLLAFGSVHFLEQSFASLLHPLSPRPRHLLLNKLPLSENETFFTLHNMGPALVPYRVANRKEFLQSMDDLGYELVDSWKNPEFACFIPGYPDHSVREYSGMYLRQK